LRLKGERKNTKRVPRRDGGKKGEKMKKQSGKTSTINTPVTVKKKRKKWEREKQKRNTTGRKKNHLDEDQVSK